MYCNFKVGSLFSWIKIFSDSDSSFLSLKCCLDTWLELEEGQRLYGFYVLVNLAGDIRLSSYMQMQLGPAHQRHSGPADNLGLSFWLSTRPFVQSRLVVLLQPLPLLEVYLPLTNQLALKSAFATFQIAMWCAFSSFRFLLKCHFSVRPIRNCAPTTLPFPLPA